MILDMATVSVPDLVHEVVDLAVLFCITIHELIRYGNQRYTFIIRMAPIR